VITVADDPIGNGWYYRAQYIVSADRETRWLVVDAWSPFGFGAPSPDVLTWADDSSGVYVLERAWGDGCDQYGSAGALARIDVVDGSRTAIVEHLYNPALAPDGDTVVYSVGPERVVARQLDGFHVVTGTIAHESYDSGWQVGDYVWSPSGEAVAFTFTSHPCSTSGIARMELDTGQTTVLLPEAAGMRIVTDWPRDDTLVVSIEEHAFSPTNQPPVEVNLDAVTGAKMPD
jgi:hypothetical protein